MERAIERAMERVTEKTIWREAETTRDYRAGVKDVMQNAAHFMKKSHNAIYCDFAVPGWGWVLWQSKLHRYKQKTENKYKKIVLPRRMNVLK